MCTFAQQAMMQGWQPLSEPSHGAAAFRAWRPLLESDAARHNVLVNGEGASDGHGQGASGKGSTEDDPYLVAVREVVIPPVRTAVLNAWEPRDPEPLLAWVEVRGEPCNFPVQTFHWMFAARNQLV